MPSRDVIRRIPADGNRWLGGSTWRGHAVAGILVPEWVRREADMDRSGEAILRRVREASSFLGAADAASAGPRLATPGTSETGSERAGFRYRMETWRRQPLLCVRPEPDCVSRSATSAWGFRLV